MASLAMFSLRIIAGAKGPHRRLFLYMERCSRIRTSRYHPHSGARKPSVDWLAAETGARCRMAGPVTCPCPPCQNPSAAIKKQTEEHHDEDFNEQARGLVARGLGRGIDG